MSTLGKHIRIKKDGDDFLANLMRELPGTFLLLEMMESLPSNKPILNFQ
jgi:hypothetical protein